MMPLVQRLNFCRANKYQDTYSSLKKNVLHLYYTEIENELFCSYVTNILIKNDFKLQG